MREKTPALIVTFDTTAAAMAMESFCLAHRLPGRLIPVPRAITAGCGLAWKAPSAEESRLREAWAAAGLRWSAMHLIDV